MGLIDADALPQQPQPLPPPNIPVCDAVGPYGAGLICGARAVVQMIREAPTIDAVPVVHGRWEYKPDLSEKETYELSEKETYECSACGEPWLLYFGTPAFNGMNYCPNCGARMDGEGG